VNARSILTAALAAALSQSAFAGDRPADTKSGVYSFGTLKAPKLETARDQAKAWLESVKPDALASTSFAAIWDSPDTPLLDRVAATLSLGDATAAKLLTEARDPAVAAPKEVPAVIRDAKLPPYFRANLALAYAKSLTGKRVYEEALESLKFAVPEQVVDPAAYYFHKAVAEHALLQKKEAANSISRLLDDVAETPERYKMVATLMFFDMQGWKDDDKDLAQIARLMDNSERRLDLGRAGPKTQELQKKIVFRLDELIKDLENQCKNGQCQCPGGVPQPGPGSNQPIQPQQDSQIQTNSGPGMVDPKKLQHIAEIWGKLPEKERAKAMMEMTKDLPPRYREVIENYFKTLARSSSTP
jgi:hypothetical protein